MPDTNPTRQSTNEHLNQVERDVLYLLTETGDQPLWSLDDIGREIENEGEVDVAVKGLFCAGLSHRTCDGFVFATRAGFRAVQMIGHII